ncbi:MAG: Tn3 family transposase [Pseudomonadota bacterium]
MGQQPLFTVEDGPARPQGKKPSDLASCFKVPEAGGLEEAAMTAANGFDLSTAFMTALRAARIIAPGPSTFERLCAAALVTAERRVQTRITGALSPAQRRSLQRLLELEAGERFTPLGALRRPLGGHGPNDLKELLDRVETLRAVAIPTAFDGVPAPRLAQLARECERVSVAHLPEMRHDRRMALLAAFAVERRAQITDDALDLGLRLTGSLFKRAERRHLDALVDSRRSIGAVVRAHVDLGQALLAAREAGVDLGQAINAALGWDGLVRSVETAVQLRTPISADVLERIEVEHPRLRRFGAALLATFTFRSGSDMADLLDAVARLKTGTPTTDAPMAFVSPRWRKVINADESFNAKVYKICVFAKLRDALRAGDVWVEDSQRYRRFQDRLLATAATLAAAKTGPVADLLKRDAGGWIFARRQRVDALLAQAERQAATGALPDAVIRDGRLSITPLRATSPDATRTLARQLYDLLPRVRITDLLEEVDGWTGFGDCFGHMKSGAPPTDRRAFYAALIADGLNLGLTRMSEACDGTSYWKLARLVDWHVREDAYSLATAALVEAQERAPIAALWGDGTTSSSDGQCFGAAGRARAASTANLRYGTEPGVKYYTHVSDQFAPFATRAIAAAPPEAPHVLDGLLQHRGRAPIKEHHTDTGGFTDHVFALCALLDFRFAPRIRDLPDKRLYIFDGAPPTPTLSPLIARHIRHEHIQAHWPDISCLAASIKVGHVSAAQAVATLSATGRQNALAAALGEIGRIERTIFTLEWMLDPDLRRRVQLGLNRGEARNNLTRAVFFNRLGQLHDRGEDAHQRRAAGCNLIVAAIILWNTVYLARAVDTLRTAGAEAPADLLQHVWPLAWDNIILTGDYRWSNDNPTSTEALRPLRLERLPTRLAA